MLKRSQNKPTLQNRLLIQAARFKIEADALPPGSARDAMVRKARQIETASQLDVWLSSPGLQPPV